MNLVDLARDPKTLQFDVSHNLTHSPYVCSECVKDTPWIIRIFYRESLRTYKTVYLCYDCFQRFSL